MDKVAQCDAGCGTDQAIGAALRELRAESGLSASQLAAASGVSAAMISRIENAQVSPSLSSLSAIAGALDVPLVSLFRETATAHADYTIVRRGEGQTSTRMANGHRHDYVNLAHHTRRDLRFEAQRVVLVPQDTPPPIYVGHGVVFIQVLDGRAIYRYGSDEFELSEGDSISIDAELSHGFVKVLSPEFSFLTVQAERR